MSPNQTSPRSHHINWRAYNHSKTDLFQVEPSTKDTWGHLPVAQLKMKVVGAKPWLAGHASWLNQPWLGSSWPPRGACSLDPNGSLG